MLESLLFGVIGNHWRAVTILMSASVAAAIIVAIFFLETAGSELESISLERTRLSRSYQRGARRRPPRPLTTQIFCEPRSVVKR